MFQKRAMSFFFYNPFDDEIDHVDIDIDLTVTSPTSSPRDTIVRVKVAEIRRGCKVQKVSGSRRFDLGVPGEQSSPGSYTSQSNLR